MNDFLRNLRSAHKKDNSNSKRNLTGHYYPKEERRQTSDRRSNYPESLDNLLIALLDFLPEVANNVNKTTLNSDKLLANNNSVVEAKLRQLNSITQFFNNLNTLFSEDFFAQPFVQKTDTKKRTTASYTVGDHYTKNDILNIIKAMRKKGSTFGLIAEYLTDKGIPTFSGRGEWHAQTIHRLCKV